MKLDIVSDPFYHLGCAVVKQAVDDWHMATKRIRNGTAKKEHATLKREVERWLRSPWPEFYCDIDGKIILKRLKGSC